MAKLLKCLLNLYDGSKEIMPGIWPDTNAKMEAESKMPDPYRRFIGDEIPLELTIVIVILKDICGEHLDRVDQIAIDSWFKEYPLNPLDYRVLTQPPYKEKTAMLVQKLIEWDKCSPTSKILKSIGNYFRDLKYWLLFSLLRN